MSTILVMCWIYNFVLLCEGHGSRLNLLAVVLLSVAMVGRWTVIARSDSAIDERRFLRRLGVFLVGGFICPRCGEARVRLGGGWTPVFTCPGCERFYFLSPGTSSKMEVKKMWRLVWRRWR